jgi:4-hydroxy-tetrahydrodipicolinate synthase
VSPIPCRLAKIPEVQALKDAAGSVEMTSEVASLCDITILSGDDTLTLPMMAVGELALQLDTRL